MKTYRFICFVMVFLWISCSSQPKRKSPEFYGEIYQQAIHNYYTHRDSVLHYYKEMLQHYPSQPTLQNQVQRIYFTGLYYSYQNKADSALLHYRLADSLLTETSDLKADILSSVLAAAHNQRKNALKEKSLERFRELVENLNNTRYTAQLYSIQGTMAARKGNNAEAIRWYHMADSLYHTSGFHLFRPHILYCMGKNEATQSNYHEAFSYYQSALSLTNQYHTTHLQPEIYKGLSRLCRKQKRYEDALEYIRQMENGTTDKRHIAEAYEAYAIIYAEQKMWNQAEAYMLKSLDLRLQLGYPAAIAVSKTNLGTLYRRMGDTAKGISYYEDALTYRYQNKLEGTSLLRNLNNLGDLYLKQSNYNKAIALFENAITFTRQHPNLRLSAHAHLKLAELHKTQGNFAMAMEEYAKYIEEDKSLNAEESEQHMAELMTQYEVKKQKQMIALQQKEVKYKNAALVFLFITIVLVVIAGAVRLFWYRDKTKNLKESVRQKEEINRQQLQIRDLKTKLETEANADEVNPLADQLLKMFNQQKVYTDPCFSLDKLARMMNTNTSYVSNAINSGFDCNFKTLVSKYRVDYCKQQLLEDALQHKTLKEIASEAGFVSLSTFYTAFKKETGFTPAQFREERNINT